MRATYITACAIGALVVLWLASGQLRDEPPLSAKNIAEKNQRVDALREERPLTRVRIATIHATLQERVVNVRGRTQNKRSVTIQSQIGGLLTSRPVERGDNVTQGQLLCQISTEDREAFLSEATATARQANIEYEGSLRLSKQGLQSETAIAQSKANLASANAKLSRAKLNQQRLQITAPFDGVIEAVHLELGQYVVPGASCVTLVDLHPMLLIGNVSESELGFFSVGQKSLAVLADGREVSGDVSFVAKTADEKTRTYPIEIHVDNQDFSIPSGLTAQINVAVEKVNAQKISPALLILNDEGVVGARTIDNNNIVNFFPIEILSDEVDGIWVTGLPDIVQIITVGQQLVVSGEEVASSHNAFELVQSNTGGEGDTL